jgi:ATP-dependent protease HslVU (ClpYQ) peptidase subunit
MFWKKSPEEKLNKKYDQLIKEAYELSKVDRRKADLKQAEAEAVLKEIEALQKVDK